MMAMHIGGIQILAYYFTFAHLHTVSNDAVIHIFNTSIWKVSVPKGTITSVTIETKIDGLGVHQFPLLHHNLDRTSWI